MGAGMTDARTTPAYRDDRAHVFHSWSAQNLLDPLVITGGEGAWITDEGGTRYLDFASQLMNVNIGHQHPKLIEAIKAQADELCTLAPAHANPARSEAARMISEKAGHDLDMVFFTNGGADANENAIRMARLVTGRDKVISTYRSYHGNTGAAIAATGDWRRVPNEFARGHVHVFGPYLYRSEFWATTPEQESERALRIFTAVGDPWGTGIASQLRSEWLILAGRLEEALAVSDNAARIVDGLSSVSDLLQMRAQSVGILLRLGRLDEARTRADEMEAVAAADGSVRALSQARMAAAQVEISAGDGAAALRQSQAIRLEPGFPDQITAWAGAQRAQALILLDRLDEALAALREAMPLAIRSHDHPIVASVLIAVAGWNAAMGRADVARTALARARAVRGAADEHELVGPPEVSRTHRCPIGQIGRAVVAPDDSGVEPWHQIAQVEFETRQWKVRRVIEVIAEEHALFPGVEAGQFVATENPVPQRVGIDDLQRSPVAHARPGRASTMSECAGNTFHSPERSERYSRASSRSSANP